MSICLIIYMKIFLYIDFEGIFLILHRGNSMSYQQKEENINKLNKEALQVSKEIAVKFIETQRITTSNFEQIFPSIHKVVLETIKEGQKK